MRDPLVSLIVLTFNSSKYVIDTLESIKSQTYKNIELIISDDCSYDDTVQVCKAWIENNPSAFVHQNLITHHENTGIAANCNRGILASCGVWLMLIGADDALLPNCVDDNINYIFSNPEIRVLHSQSYRYVHNFRAENKVGIRDFSKIIITHPLITARQQYEILLRGCLINPTTFFIQRSLIEEVGMIDEDIPMVDDWPLWLRITKRGIKIYFLNKITACYRIRHDSIANENIQGSIFNDHIFRQRNIYKKYIFCNISIIEKFFINYEYIRIIFLKRLRLTSPNLVTRSIAYFTSRPTVWYSDLKRKLIHAHIRKELN